jgi:hypothetical protein
VDEDVNALGDGRVETDRLGMNGGRRHKRAGGEREAQTQMEDLVHGCFAPQADLLTVLNDRRIISDIPGNAHRGDALRDTAANPAPVV